MTVRALFFVLAALPVAGLTGCDVQPVQGKANSRALLVAELENRLAGRFAEDARAGLDKMELCLKRFAHTRSAQNADALVEVLEREHDALLEVLQAEELRLLGVDLINPEGEAVERLELEVVYEQGQLEYAWNADALEVLHRIAVRPDLRAELWCESESPPRGWAARTSPPLARGARHHSLGEVLQRGRLRVRMGLTSAGRLIPEG